MSTRDQSYYEVLEVNPTAPQHEIHAAYQRAKQTYSTDSPALYSMFSQEEAQELLKIIEEAFSVLGNHSLRKSYDEKLKRQDDWGSDSSSSVVSAHHPDLAPTEIENSPVNDDWSSPSLSIQPQESFEAQESKDEKENEEVADSYIRTPLSAYCPDEDFEENIASTEVFDGEILQQIREYKNIPLGQLSEYTRISRAYLQAIETNSYTNLPAPVFVRGFIIQIAKVLLLDEKKVAGSYMKLLKEKV